MCIYVVFDEHTLPQSHPNFTFHRCRPSSPGLGLSLLLTLALCTCVPAALFARQALVGLDRGEKCFQHPVYPDDDGFELLEWDGECLTFEGEINKMATNVAIGRLVSKRERERERERRG